MENNIFEKGQKAPAEWFTGEGWVNQLMAPNENLRNTIGDVKFSPSARTRRHVHPVEQVLPVTGDECIESLT